MRNRKGVGPEGRGGAKEPGGIEEGEPQSGYTI